MTISRLTTINDSNSYFLFGPRGTGKTTLLREKFPDSLYINLLNKTIFIDLLKDPERLESMITTGMKHVIIDEVQKIPDLLDVVHRLIEEKNISFILTGSSARKLKRSNANLLAGRALNAKMYPLTIEELGERFRLEDTIQYGFLPTLYDKDKTIDPKEYLTSYVDTYLREEVNQEGLTKDLGGFVRFLEVASFSQGEVTNLSEVAREAQISRKVVESYFSILEDLLIANFLPVFTKRAKRKLIKQRKFYYFDVGVFQNIRPKGVLDNLDNLIGASLETIFYQEVIALNHYRKLGYTIYFWRSITGTEVDFILYSETRLIAVEVKASKTIRRKDFRGLKEFKKDYDMAELFYLYQGDRKEEYGDITAMNLISFLKEF